MKLYVCTASRWFLIPYEIRLPSVYLQEGDVAFYVAEQSKGWILLLTRNGFIETKLATLESYFLLAA
jgi:hypothetical protein